MTWLPSASASQPFRASRTTGRWYAARREPSSRWGDDFGADEETVLAGQFDRPVLVHYFTRAGEGVLHEGATRIRASPLCVDDARTGGYGGSSAADSAKDDLAAAAA